MLTSEKMQTERRRLRLLTERVRCGLVCDDDDDDDDDDDNDG